jgi:two-component system, sporulation sensor kinase E
MSRFLRKAIDKVWKLGRPQLEELLGKSLEENQLLSSVMDSMDEGVLVCDPKNRVLFWNKALERLVPLMGHEYQGRLAWHVIAEKSIADFVHETLESEDSVKDRQFTLDLGGQPRVLSCSVQALVQKGKIQGSLIMFRDATVRIVKEARLRRAESLASLTTLAAGVAHEIKNPLGSMGIHLQLMRKSLEQFGTCSKEESEEFLDIFDEEVEKLNKIVVDFLFAVRPMDLELKNLCIVGIFDEILGFLEEDLKSHNIQVYKEYEKGLPEVPLDGRYIKQALLNLIKNAVAAMPDGGDLKIHGGVKGDFLEIKVEDTGTGIPREEMDKIFEPYFTTKSFGSGLGLTLVFKIVKEHRGDIQVHSRVGEGTCFHIQLPLPRSGTQALLSSPKSSSEGGY